MINVHKLSAILVRWVRTAVNWCATTLLNESCILREVTQNLVQRIRNGGKRKSRYLQPAARNEKCVSFRAPRTACFFGSLMTNVLTRRLNCRTTHLQHNFLFSHRPSGPTDSFISLVMPSHECKRASRLYNIWAAINLRPHNHIYDYNFKLFVENFQCLTLRKPYTAIPSTAT